MGIWALPIFISYFSVNEIHLTEEKMTFKPIGLEVNLADIIEIKKLDEFQSDYLSKYISRFEIETKPSKFRWIPFSVLWAQDRLFIRASGIAAQDLALDLHQRMNKKTIG